VTSLVRDHGVYAVFLLMLVDAVFPAASELVMVVGGTLASGAFGASIALFGTRIHGGLATFVVVAAAGTLGYLAGSLVGWGIGRYGGRPLLERHGSWFHLDEERLDRAERWFERWGLWAVFLGRVTPVVRSFVSIPAGVFRVPLVPYAALTLAGSALWAFALAGVGWGAGSGYEHFHHDFAYAEYAVVAGVVVLAAYLVLRRKRSTTIR
jgi:membrane protein DedA with SNARE-associated domain